MIQQPETSIEVMACGHRAGCRNPDSPSRVLDAPTLQHTGSMRSAQAV